LLTELGNPNTQVRRQAIADIMRRRSERAQAYSALLMLLNDSEVEVCKAAIKALGTLNDPRAFPDLVQMLRHRSSYVRLLTLKTLEQLDFTQTIPYWIAAWWDRSKRIRQAATAALGNGRAVEHLIATLNGVDGLIRWRAAEVLGESGDTRAVEPLITALGDTKKLYIRQEAISALGKLGDARAVEPLITALSDTDSSVRRSAAEVLGKLGDVRAVPALQALLADPIIVVAQQARQTIAQLEGLA
jgi:HEAT repeat protein